MLSNLVLAIIASSAAAIPTAYTYTASADAYAAAAPAGYGAELPTATQNAYAQATSMPILSSASRSGMTAGAVSAVLLVLAVL